MYRREPAVSKSLSVLVTPSLIAFVSRPPTHLGSSCVGMPTG